jgi:predicted transcriptional regulator
MSDPFKQQAHKLIDQLPDDATWSDLAERVRFLAEIEDGIKAADRGEFASPEQVRAMFGEWAVDVTH